MLDSQTGLHPFLSEMLLDTGSVLPPLLSHSRVKGCTELPTFWVTLHIMGRVVSPRNSHATSFPCLLKPQFLRTFPNPYGLCYQPHAFMQTHIHRDTHSHTTFSCHQLYPECSVKHIDHLLFEPVAPLPHGLDLGRSLPCLSCPGSFTCLDPLSL